MLEGRVAHGGLQVVVRTARGREEALGAGRRARLTIWYWRAMRAKHGSP